MRERSDGVLAQTVRVVGWMGERVGCLRTGSGTGPPWGGQGSKGRNLLDCIRGKGVRVGCRGALPSENKTTEMVLTTFSLKWLNSRPESGLDWLVCSKLARQRVGWVVEAQAAEFSI